MATKARKTGRLGGVLIPENQEERLAIIAAKRQAEDKAQRAKYRTIIQAGIGQWIKDFKEGKIAIKTVADLRQLIELDFYLRDK